MNGPKQKYNCTGRDGNYFKNGRRYQLSIKIRNIPFVQILHYPLTNVKYLLTVKMKIIPKYKLWQDFENLTPSFIQLIRIKIKIQLTLVVLHKI